MIKLKMTDLTLESENHVIMKKSSACFDGGKYYALLGDNMSDLGFFRKYFEGDAGIQEGSFDLEGFSEEEIYFLSLENELFDTLSVTDNILIGQIGTFQRKEKVLEMKQILAELDWKIDLKKKVRTIGQGEQILIELLRGYFLGRKVFILENTYSILTYHKRKIFERMLDRILLDGRMVILLTNSVEHCFFGADEIILFNEKRVRDRILADELKKNPREILRRNNGWKSMRQEEDDMDVSEKFVDFLTGVSEISTMTQEIEQIFAEFQKYGCQYTSADCMDIYLYDTQTGEYISSLSKEETHQQGLRPEVIRNVEFEGFQCEYYEEERFEELFQGKMEYNTVLINSFTVEKYVRIYICLLFREHYIYTKQDYLVMKTLRKELEMAVERTRLIGKSTLLQESHHRIKNSLQLVVSTLTLQKMFYASKEDINIDEVIDKTISEIKSIAAIHDLMSKNDIDSNTVNIREIIETIVSFYQGEQFHVSMDIDNLIFPYYKATNFVIVVNELVNNCVKYGKSEDGICRIRIVCKKENDSIHLTVSDRGKGYPEKKLQKDSGLGLSLLKNIIQHDFKTELELGNWNGAVASMTIKTSNIFAK